MERKEKLNRLFGDLDENLRFLIDPMLDEVIFLEKKLTELKKYPLLSVNPKNKCQQKVTAAGKQYKEYIQSYSNIIKTLCSLLNKGEESETDPVTEFLKNHERNLETRG